MSTNLPPVRRRQRRDSRQVRSESPFLQRMKQVADFVPPELRDEHSSSTTDQTKDIFERRYSIADRTREVELDPRKLDQETQYGVSSPLNRRHSVSTERTVSPRIGQYLDAVQKARQNSQRNLLNRSRSFQVSSPTAVDDSSSSDTRAVDDSEQQSNKTPPRIPRIPIPKYTEMAVDPQILAGADGVCSPHLTESRIKIKETERILTFQQNILRLRITFWKIEHCREQAIAQYQAMARHAGYQICENCKRMLRKRHRPEKQGNYHLTEVTAEGRKRYRCHFRSYDDYFINTPADRFFV